MVEESELKDDQGIYQSYIRPFDKFFINEMFEKLLSKLRKSKNPKPTTDTLGDPWGVTIDSKVVDGKIIIDETKNEKHER